MKTNNEDGWVFLFLVLGLLAVVGLLLLSGCSSPVPPKECPVCGSPFIHAVQAYPPELAGRKRIACTCGWEWEHNPPEMKRNYDY